MPFPGLGSSGDEVFGEHGRCDLSPPPSLPLGFLGVQPAHLRRWMSRTPRSLGKEACLQFGRKCLSGAAIAPFWLWLPVTGRGWSAAGYLFSPLFCERAWRCLRALCVVAIPQSGLLAEVSSLRLPSGHSSSILTLSNAARASLSSPRLLVAGTGVCAASPLG